MGFTYLKFYTADWLEDTATLSLQGQGLWMRVICRLSKSQTPGEATYTQPVWSRLLGIPSVEFPSFVTELLDGGVGEVIENDDDTWTIRSNRMVKDWQEFGQVSEKRRAAGRAGGQASARARGKPNGQASAEANASSLLQQSVKQKPTDGQALPEARSQKPEAKTIKTQKKPLTGSYTPCEIDLPNGLDEVVEYFELHGCPKWIAEDWFDSMESAGWIIKGTQIRKWRHFAIKKIRWWEAEGKPKTREAKANGSHPSGKKNPNPVNRNAGTANEGLADDYEAFAQQQAGRP